ncbi:hypothetical protein HBI04_159090 [Parastagonospora nodorum]|nr:hypothetical protein HBI03_164090 [Parastagonospora nodorum]KAH4269721.1 hypothetical protein HBI04_159090 [Parastagonospora nodorum]
MLTLILSKTAHVALLTKLAILNNANIALVDAIHYSIIDILIIMLIKDDNNLLSTVNSYIKLRRLRARYKTKAVDSRYAKVSRGRTKKDKDLEDSNTSSDVLRLCRRNRAAASQLKKTRDKEKLAKAKKEKEEKESLCKSRDSNRILHSRRLIDVYILYFKELLSNNSRIFANAISIGKMQAIVLAVLIEHFYFFSNSSLENIGRLTKEKVIEMQINTTNAIFKALTAANKLFIIVCSFRKVDKHIFRAYNTISVTAQRTIIRKGSSYIEKRFNATNKKDSVTSNCIYKIEDARNIIANIKYNASEHKLSYKDILEKEGFNKLEASRRIIFNCFKISCKVKRFTLNSIKDLFTNLSKDYFLVREARAITKSSLNIAAEDIAKAANILLLLKKVCAKILIESYKLIVQAIIVALIAFAEVIILTEATHVLAEICVSIVYFNLDSKLELKVLSKQDVKITS